jgi:two-component system response regulator MprA
VTTKRTILIVDDEAAIVETLVELLTWEGYETVTADDGQAALVALEQHKPDLVLLDFMMPRMDGVRVLERMRSDVRWCATPVVFMTAARLPNTDAKSSAVLKKPFETARLLSTVRGLIG